MSKRIKHRPSGATIQTIDRMARPGQRSRFINIAVQQYVANRSVEAVRAQLERAAVRDRDLDREIAADWFAVDQETGKKPDDQPMRKKRANRSAVEFASRRSIRP